MYDMALPIDKQFSGSIYLLSFLSQKMGETQISK